MRIRFTNSIRCPDCKGTDFDVPRAKTLFDANIFEANCLACSYKAKVIFPIVQIAIAIPPPWEEKFKIFKKKVTYKLPDLTGIKKP